MFREDLRSQQPYLSCSRLAHALELFVTLISAQKIAELNTNTGIFVLYEMPAYEQVDPKPPKLFLFRLLALPHIQELKLS